MFVDVQIDGTDDLVEMKPSWISFSVQDRWRFLTVSLVVLRLVGLKPPL
jgi:hypothetical protein